MKQEQYNTNNHNKQELKARN